MLCLASLQNWKMSRNGMVVWYAPDVQCIWGIKHMSAPHKRRWDDTERHSRNTATDLHRQTSWRPQHCEFHTQCTVLEMRKSAVYCTGCLCVLGSGGDGRGGKRAACIHTLLQRTVGVPFAKRKRKWNGKWACVCVCVWHWDIEIFWCSFTNGSTDCVECTIVFMHISTDGLALCQPPKQSFLMPKSDDFTSRKFWNSILT